MPQDLVSKCIRPLSILRFAQAPHRDGIQDRRVAVESVDVVREIARSGGGVLLEDTDEAHDLMQTTEVSS